MYIYVTTTFEDLTCGAERSAGTVLEVTDERAAEIVSAGYAKSVQVIDAMPVAEPAEEPEVKKDGSERKGTGKKAASRK